MNKTSYPPILFIVEGRTDKVVVPHFFNSLDVGADGMHEEKFAYDEMKGWLQFESYITKKANELAARLDAQDLECLIILVDGDDKDPTERTRTLIEIIKANKKLSERNLTPSDQYVHNTIERIRIGEGMLHFGIYILQSKDENNEYSDLESLVLNNSKQKRPKHFDLVKNFTSEFLKVLKDDAPAQPGDLNKAKWHIYLALCNETKGLGVNEKKLEKLLPECFNLSLETDNMHVLKQCYEDLKRIMNQDGIAKESS